MRISAGDSSGRGIAAVNPEADPALFQVFLRAAYGAALVAAVDDDGAVGEDVEVAAACRCVCGDKTHFGMPRQEQQQLPVLQSGASFAAGAGFGQDADDVAARLSAASMAVSSTPRAPPLMGMRAAAMVKISRNR